ncbi:MAG: DHHW family protein [Clostridia bacterium]
MKNKIFIIVIITFWTLISILNIAVPKKEFSEKENRYLAKFPKVQLSSIKDGTLTPKIEQYINDHFIFRDKWIYLKSTTELALGKTQNNNIYVGKDGYLFERFDAYNIVPKDLTKNIEVLDRFSKKASKNANIYTCILPNSIQIYKDKLPKNAVVADQKKLTQYIYMNLPSSININTIDALEAKKNDEQLYFKTDHHMTSYGAYYAYVEICKALNIEPTAKEEYTKKTVTKSFFGTFDSKAGIVFTKPDNIDILENEKNKSIKEAAYDNKKTSSIYNYEYLNKKDKYSFFLNGNNAKVVLKTNETNGKKLLLIKDSYSHIFIQFLVQHYEEIHLIDPRYYKLPITEYIKQNEINDVVILYNINNFISDLGIRTIS